MSHAIDSIETKSQHDSYHLKRGYDPMLQNKTARADSGLGDHTNGHAEGRVIHTPGILGGDACIRGTRLAVWGLEHWRRLGWDDARILDAYPQLTKEDLAAAWEYVATHTAEIDEAIRENEEA